MSTKLIKDYPNKFYHTGSERPGNKDKQGTTPHYPKHQKFTVLPKTQEGCK